MSSNFREVIFSKSEFQTSILVLNTRYIYLKSENNNLVDPFNDKLDYILAYWFAELETIKCNIDKFLTNLLVKPIIKMLLYCNIDKWIKTLSTIPQAILDNKSI